MKYYQFKTFTTSYYFPKLNAGQKYMYGLYSPYGGKLSKIYWWLFRKSRLVRNFTNVKEDTLPFPYLKIRQVDGTDSLMSFNMGSPGVEQKISILGYDNKSDKPFFAKFSQKSAALKLTENEIKVYRLLTDTGLTPQLLGSKVGEDYAYLKAEYVPGKRLESRELTETVVGLCISLAEFHLNKDIECDGLKHSLSHGDFCPWNILCHEGKIRLIDWELADERPLGYDLFTYICNVAALFEPETPLIAQIDRNTNNINSYFSSFGVEDYTPYLRSFAKSKYKYEASKGNSTLAEPYQQLLNCL